MKKVKIKKWLVNRSFFFVMVACANDTSFSVPDISCIDTDLESTHTMQQIKEMAGFGVREFTEDTIISGYVVSSDRDGNFYKTLILQDALENPTCALRFVVDLTENHATYELGRKVFVKLKGLAIGYLFGHLSIGASRGNDLENISSFLMEQHFVKSCDKGVVLPKPSYFSELDEDDVGLLLGFSGVQFHPRELGKTYANTSDTKTVDLKLQQWTLNCDGQVEIILKNSGFTNFKSQQVSSRKGELTAILEKRYEQYYLVIRNLEDVFFEQTRCQENEVLESTITIKELQAKYDGELVEFGIDEILVTEGFLISSDQEGNFINEMFLQDAVENPKAGIRILIDKENYFETYAIGQKIKLKLNKLYMDNTDGKWTIGFYEKGSVGEISEEELHDFIIETKEIHDLRPLEIQLGDAMDLWNENILVSLSDVQLLRKERGKAFTYFSGKESAIRLLESCGGYQKIGVLTQETAHFSNQKFPTGNGQITGVLCKENFLPTLQLRRLEDVSFYQGYQDCPTTNPQILITEIADPVNSSGARFVELYNAGMHPVDLSGWSLKKYINGSTAPSGEGVLLNGVVEANTFFIVAGAAFSSVFSKTANLTNAYISGNGDDVYELVDPYQQRQDIYGVLGEDGSGKSWEYTDGRALRKEAIESPTSDFEILQWEVFSKTSGTAKMAPQDFSPGFR